MVKRRAMDRQLTVTFGRIDTENQKLRHLGATLVHNTALKHAYEENLVVMAAEGVVWCPEVTAMEVESHCFEVAGEGKQQKATTQNPPQL